MKFLSVCSGIEAASVAWHDLGFECVGVSEIEKFPSAVLNYHYPSVPNLGDMTRFKEWKDDLAPDLLVGGTPCQSFSVAGLRKGMDDPRGNLALTYVRIAEKYKPQWFIWENVPGVLSSNGGKDFSSFLSAMADIGYGIAYRVLDAQFFGVPQRRRRVFVVGYLGDWRPPTAVLFEPSSVFGNTPKGRKARKGNTASAETSTRGNGKGLNQTSVYFGSEPNISDTVTSKWHKGSGGPSGNECGLFVGQKNKESNVPFVRQAENTMRVRRLTPIECERLQGFPDNWTQIPYGKRPKEQCPNGHRYKALGNTMAVPVMRWIGRRIALFESLKT